MGDWYWVRGGREQESDVHVFFFVFVVVGDGVCITRVVRYHGDLDFLDSSRVPLSIVLVLSLGVCMFVFLGSLFGIVLFVCHRLFCWTGLLVWFVGVSDCVGNPCMLLGGLLHSHGSVLGECAFYIWVMLGSLFPVLGRTTIHTPGVGGYFAGIGVVE